MRRAEPRSHRAAQRAVRGRRITAVLLAVALALAACSGPDDTSAPEASDAPLEVAPSPPADDTDADAAVDDPVTSEDEQDEQDVADGPVDDPSPRPSPVAPGPPPPPEGRAELAERIQDLVDAAGVSAPDIELGVLVTDEYGREIAGHQPDLPLLPASTQKVVTAAAILTTLGPTGRFTTRVEATAPIDATGALHGDLVLVGGGDPALATDEYARWVYPARPTTPLADLADALVAQGLRRLEGDIVGVAPGFTGESRAAGWPDRYFGSFDARYAAGLTVDGGLRTILTYPEPDGDAAGQAEGSDSTDGQPDADGQEASGDATDPEDLGPPTVTVDHVTDPTAHAAGELRRLLEERDIEVVGESRSGEVAATPVGRLAAVDSPPMGELLRFTVERSDNHLADGMFRAIGRIRTGEGSWARGDRAVRQVLDRFGIDHGAAVFADGSGLSRDDRLTARLLVDLDRHMSDGPIAETWVSLMAVMGESGTLRERLRGTVAAGRFHGKTGTLRDVTALSGAVVGDDGTRYHLAVLANEASGPGRWVARQLMDELVLQLSAEVAGCGVAIARAEPEAGSDAASAPPDPPPLPRSVITC